MSYINIIIGLGGTGIEVVEEFVKIQDRYNISNPTEWFVMDVKTLKSDSILLEMEKNDSNNVKRIYKLDHFQNSTKAIKKVINSNNKKLNISDIFHYNDTPTILDDLQGASNQNGCWNNRRLGYLSFFYYLNIQRKKDDFLEVLEERIDLHLQNNPKYYLRLFIVNSFCGGTGSGMYLPLAALLKNKLDSRVNNVQYFLISPLFNVVNKGNRKGSSTQQRDFQANDYQSLLELELFNPNSDIVQNILGDWEIIYNEDYESSIKFGEKLFDYVLLLNDEDTETGGFAEDYKPYYHMISWLLYLWSSFDENTAGIIGDIYQGGNKHIYGSFGLSVFEFPKYKLLEEIKNRVWNEFKNVYQPIINKTKTNKIPQTNNIVASLETKFQEEFNQFTKQLSNERRQHSNKLRGEDVSQIKTEHAITIDFLNPGNQNNIKNKITKTIIDQIDESYRAILLGMDFDELIQYYDSLTELISQEKDKEATIEDNLESELSSLEEQIQKLENKKSHIKQARKLALQYFDIYNKEKIRNIFVRISDTILDEIEERNRFVTIIKESILNLKFDETFVHTQDQSNLPVIEIPGDHDPLLKEENITLDDIELELLKSIKGDPTLDKKEKIYSYLAHEFFRGLISVTLNEYLQKKYTDIYSNQLEKQQFVDSYKSDLHQNIKQKISKYLTTFLNQKLDLNDYNKIIECFNNNELPLIHIYSYPPKYSSTNVSKKNVIFVNSEIEDKINKNILKQYSIFSIGNAIPKEIMIILELTGDLDFQKFTEINEIDKKYYEQEILLEKKKLNFLDPRFEEKLSDFIKKEFSKT